MITMRRVLSCLYHINPQFRCLLIPKPSFLFQTQRSCWFLLHLPKKKKTKKLPLLHFWLFCTSVHSSASSKLGGGQFFNVKICTSVKICTPAWSAHAPLRVLRHLNVLLHLANVGTDAHWIRARTLGRSRHFTCDYYLCTQRCSCAIIIAHHMLSVWCNPQLRCPRFFCFVIRSCLP